MKKVLLMLFIGVVPVLTMAQVFTTGSILKTGHFSAGINPVINDQQFGMFFHGGYGLRKNLDIAARYGVLEGQDYFGVDLEWSLKNTERFQLSLITGGHARRHFGLDGGLVASIPVASYANLYAGIDIDLDFDNEINHYTWVPIGIEVSWRDQMSILLEADIPMSEWAWNIFGGGIAIYF
jgi:hypothetical protein